MTKGQISAARVFDGHKFVSHQQIFWENGCISRVEQLATASMAATTAKVPLIIPGLINLHCHLELSNLAQLLPQQVAFPQWVDALQSHTAKFTSADWEAGVLHGLQASLQAGTTAIFDVGNSRATWSAASATPLRLWAAVELLGASAKIAPPPPGPAHHQRGYSAHAVYSCGAKCWQTVVDFCQTQAFPFSVHLAESTAEHELLCAARGPLRSWLDRKVPQHQFTSPGLSAWDRACSLGLPAHSIVAHGNTLSPTEITAAAARQIGLVHCPQSAQWFGHPPLDFASCDRAGLAVSLGTDSLASAHSLSLWEQMRTFAQQHPHYSPAQTLARTTSVPGRILGGTPRLGELTPGAAADFVILDWDETWDTLPQIQQVYIAGELVYAS